MRRSNKKGFTTVELVIVIAVIAILAAVLIPTFANLIHKANVSADTQLAKNLNTVLTMYEAEGNDVDDFGDAIEAITEGGYLLSKLNPTADGHYFVWEENTNQILLVDGKDQYKVVYKSKDFKNDADATIGKTWWFAISEASDDVITYLKDKANIANAPKDGAALKDMLEDIAASGEKETIYVSADLDLSSAVNLDNVSGDVTLDLTNSKLSGVDITGAAAINVKKGNLTILNGVVNALGEMLDADGEESQFPIHTDVGTYTKIEGTTFNIDTTKNGYLHLYGSADINNVTVNSSDMGIGAYGGSTFTVEKTTVNATGHAAFFVSNASAPAGKTTTLTVKSGTYKGGDVDGTDYKRACLQAYNGKLIIEGGTFTSNTSYMFHIHTNPGQIVIKGGTFNGIAFKDLTVAKLQAMTLEGNVTATADGFVISK